MIEEQSTFCFCIAYQGKHNGSVLLTNEQYTEQLEQTQILPIKNVRAAQQMHQKLSQLLIVVMEKQSTRFVCIIYPDKHNGTIL